MTDRDPDRRERVRTLTNQGKTVREIASLLGVTERTVNRNRAMTGVAKHVPPPISPAELATAKQLLQDGCSYAETGRTLGRNSGWIAKYLPGYGWTQTQGGKYGMLQRWGGTK